MVKTPRLNRHVISSLQQDFHALAVDISYGGSFTQPRHCALDAGSSGYWRDDYQLPTALSTDNGIKFLPADGHIKLISEMQEAVITWGVLFEGQDYLETTAQRVTF